MRAAIMHAQTHTQYIMQCNTHPPIPMCLLSVCIGSCQSWQTSGWLFRAVGPHQCSAAQQTSYQTTQSHTIHQHPLEHATHSNGLPSSVDTIPTHACPHINGHTAPLAYHTFYATTHARTHQCSQYYAPTVSHMPTQHVLHTDAHVPSHTHCTLMWHTFT